MIVGTKYDKELKEKVFYVREVDSYTHKTTTTLTVEWVDGVFTLTAVVGNLIGKGFVKFYRDGVEVGEQYVSKTATLLLQSETKTGVFVAKFMGNSDCLKSQSSEVGYSPLPHPEFSLTVDNDNGVVGDTLTFTPHLPSDATGSIVYAVDGTEYMKNVGETFSYKFNKSGSFTVSAVYSGDDSYQGATASVLVTIGKTNTVLTGTVDKTSVTFGDNVLCTLYLKDNQNNPLSNKTIYCGDLSETTDADGKVIFNYDNPSTGTVTKEFKFDGDNSYNGASVTVEWTVNKKPTILTATPDKTSVTIGENVLCTAYLKDNQNNPLANKTIYFETWSRTTDEDGKVIFNFANPNPGVVTPEFKFNGDDLYDGASVTTSWGVNRKPVTLTVTADKTSVTVGGTVTLIATVKSDGVNVNEGQVDFGDGVLVDVSNGTAVKTVTKTTPQSITFTPSYERTSTYNAATASPLTITWVEESVTPQIAIFAPTLIGEVGDDLPITISSNLKNTDLTVLLNNVEVADTVTTNDNGKAPFNYNCTGEGDVEVKVKYVDGTDVYYSNTVTLEDCLKYGFKASDTWINPTGHSATNIVENGVFTSASSSSKGDSILQLDITGDFIITYDAHWYAASRCGVGAKDTTRSYHFDSGTDSAGSNQKYVRYDGSKEVDTVYKYDNPIEYVNCKIIKENGALTGYMNGDKVLSVNYDWISQCTVWNFHTTMWNTSNIRIENLKIKSI